MSHPEVFADVLDIEHYGPQVDTAAALHVKEQLPQLVEFAKKKLLEQRYDAPYREAELAEKRKTNELLQELVRTQQANQNTSL